MLGAHVVMTPSHPGRNAVNTKTAEYIAITKYTRQPGSQNAMISDYP